MEQAKYDVFISYSRKDYVDEKGVVLEGNVISTIKDTFKKAKISYWFDEEGVYSGDEYMEKLADAIHDSSMLLFISSVNSNASEWTAGEIGTAHLYKKKIIPFRLDDSPFSRSIIVKIANLNFIEYYQNHKKAIEELVKAVTVYKEELENKWIEEQKRIEQQALLIRKKEIQAEIQSAVSDFKRLNSQLQTYVHQIFEKKESIGETLKTCPVCNKELNLRSAFCDKCGWQFPRLYALDGSENPSCDELQLAIARANWHTVVSVEDLQKENARLEQEHEALDAERESLKTSLSSHEEQMLELKEKLKNAEQERDKAIKKVEFLNESLKNCEDKFNKVSADYMFMMQNGGKSSDNQVKGIVASSPKKNASAGNSSISNPQDEIFQLVKRYCNNKNINKGTGIAEAKLKFKQLSSALWETYNIEVSEHKLKSYSSIGHLIDAILVLL